MLQQTEDFVGEWESWHNARIRATTSPRGLAALAATHWLTDVASEYDGVPGTWRASAEGIEGESGVLSGLTVLQDGRPIGSIASSAVTLTGGQEIEWGEKRLRYFERDGSLALRLIDPDLPSRVSLTGIDSFPADSEWAIPGRFIPADAGDRLEITAIDGHISEDTPAGVVNVTLPGGEVANLSVTGGPRGLSAVFADATNGNETYRFRFLSIAAPDSGGEVVVDFNRAYLPPCAFSDFYVCPLPPASNRLSTAVRAGEKGTIRAS